MNKYLGAQNLFVHISGLQMPVPMLIHCSLKMTMNRYVSRYIEKLTNDCLPLLEAMESMQSDILPREWIEAAAKGLAERAVKLQGAISIANKQYG